MSETSDGKGMMQQYLALKAQVPDALLFFQCGDFYELFYEDAREAAELLEIALTSRDRDSPDPVPMAGVPVRSVEAYVARLAEAGRKVVVAAQREPSAGPGKKLIPRDIVRVVTPGVPWTTDGLEARQACWLGGACGGGPVGLAFLDVSTGELRVTEVPSAAEAAAELTRLEARELVLDRDAEAAAPLQAVAAGLPRASADPSWFDRHGSRRTLVETLGTADLDGFGAAGLDPALRAAGALLRYAREQARADLRHVCELRVYSVSGHLVLDDATRRNLELLRPLRGTGRKGTLIGLLDRTRTAMGGRLLREWVTFPLADRRAIHERLDAVEAFLDTRARREARDLLARVADLERLCGKVAQGTANARDLVALACSLAALPALWRVAADLPALASHLPDDLAPDVATDISTWVVDEPPLALTEGDLLRTGVSPELDLLVDLARDGKGHIARIEERERRRTGIQRLKIKHNGQMGYFLEVPQTHYDKVPKEWIRKGGLAAAERYVTPELKELEEKVLGADAKRKALEYELFRELRERVAREAGRVQALGRAVAFLDAVAALADLAVDHRYCRPEVDDSRDVDIVEGRHPVVEASGAEERFVPNDVRLDAQRQLVVLTGPNMAGKSTVMRQVALIALLAQIGSFVPATRARIGLCDRIFVRVGASDDLARGRSTFMVEMSETALILNQATDRSLVLLDEIGRGTSTYDGLAIAWAVAEAVHDRVRARAIFATHYHELVALAQDKKRVVNLHVAVSEWGERILFLRVLREGGASKSYGIQCARLAGMPRAVVERARVLLQELEKRPRHGPPVRQVGLFEPPPKVPAADPIHEALAAVDPDALSPKDAHDALYRLRAMLPPKEG